MPWGTSIWPHSAPPFRADLLDAADRWIACVIGCTARAIAFPSLWRLHAVHHSPDILYSLNSGRFHPLEKSLHFGVDTLPFIVLGVGQEVIAGYFVIYAANGLFQHSNVRLRYGWLNYVVGSAETHRWHHARDPRIAGCNFGSTTAVWDVIFGTWYLPQRPTARGGWHHGQGLSEGFPRTARRAVPRPPRRRARSRRQRWLANTCSSRCGCGSRSSFRVSRIAAAVRDPMRVQRALLARILRENRDTAFGRRYRFRRNRQLRRRSRAAFRWANTKRCGRTSTRRSSAAKAR